ncbi:hydantoinase/oxoprolinase family protein [Sinimarinibacterium sp. CAU 1509]|uniref:hydantoinase/oxoprolinase family protein n=1 Tax=Sinimarinibacterium sp. CAU 1509 TaxID=2562283 RepID=UPI0010ACEEB3|nr:hydantoinase/oxoprolinase family protein [Sinimarinibacterium sp. CAU 1509]TJY59790.1 hydantoinase/oxoprolinase family protein [Sinimarinibacterium sp. CAU 1509]
MRRVSVDIGGTFTDCFVVWDERSIEGKALTTHHNLALGFNEALSNACEQLALDVHTLLSGVDSVRYATTLGTNALIERKGPRIGVLVTAGFKSTIPLSRARGYGEGLPEERQMDIPNAQRPEPIVPIPMIREIRERVDYLGAEFLRLDEDDVRLRIRELVDAGAEALVVLFTNSVVNPAHELRVREIFLEEYPGHLLGAIPMLLSHQVAGRKGEYARGMSAIMDAFLHQTMYHGLGTLELNLRGQGYERPMLVNHNSGGMAQLNSTDALQTVHSGPVSGIAASEHLMQQTGLGNVVATDMGGTSFDIGIVDQGGVKHYDFNPVIDRWLVSIPMVHLVTLGAGGGSICSYDRMFRTVKCGPASAGSDPGPACYDRGGLNPTVTDADLLLGYLDPANYAAGHIKLNPKRARQAMEDLCDELDVDTIEAAKLIKRTVDANMANGIATELRTRGYEPSDFTVLAYGGNGPLHACGIAEVLGVDRVLAPPFSSVFSAVGAGNMNQMHIHETSTWTVLFDANLKRFYADYNAFNAHVEALESRGREDLLRQGFAAEDIRYRLELDMRYGNQRVQTAVVADQTRLQSQADVIKLINQFHTRYGERFGKGSQSPETGVRINTIRVCSYVEQSTVRFAGIEDDGREGHSVEPVGTRECHFPGYDGAIETRIYDDRALAEGTRIEGPALVTTRATTYLVNPGWRYYAAAQNAVWFTRGGH